MLPDGELIIEFNDGTEVEIPFATMTGGWKKTVEGLRVNYNDRVFRCFPYRCIRSYTVVRNSDTTTED